MINECLKAVALQPAAHGGPVLSGLLRQSPEDFYVEEILGFEPEGEGEHVFLFIEKRSANTQFVAEQLAKFAGVSPRVVSFSGMKDRHALTRQWFSVQLPGIEDPDWQLFQTDEYRVLKAQRHPRKLRRGVHRANLFRLTLRQIEGDRELFSRRFDAVVQQGFPNYFGEQRFGNNGANLNSALRWFSGAFKPRRKQSGHYLSAARAFLFNQILARRVADGLWDQLLSGDIMMLEGTASVFDSEIDDAEPLVQRLAVGDIHPTGPMFGKHKGERESTDCARLEGEVLGDWLPLCEGLVAQGLKAERRALRVLAKQLCFNFIDNDDGSALELTFQLPSGCFATALMAELVDYRATA